jgi:hypothetical protein
MSGQQELTFWLELEPIWSSFRTGRDGQPALDGIRLGRATKNRPSSLRGPAVKMTVRVPSAVFDSVLPPVVVDIPESAVALPVVTVEVEGLDSEPAEAGAS